MKRGSKQRRHKHEDVIYELLADIAPETMTLAELRAEFNAKTGLDVGESSLCQPVNVLKLKGKVSDGYPKRPCRVTGVKKKVWAANPIALMRVSPR